MLKIFFIAKEGILSLGRGISFLQRVNETFFLLGLFITHSLQINGAGTILPLKQQCSTSNAFEYL